MPKLSKRLLALAGMVAFDTVADIGCDHGLLTSYLLARRIVVRAIATDINKGPLNAAAHTFKRCGVSAQLRLGDGLAPICPGEARTCVIAGMGGMTIIEMLKSKPEAAMAFDQLVLSPERDQQALRLYLHANGFRIAKEILTEEKGHFYFAMDVRPGTEDCYDRLGYAFGQYLINSKDLNLRHYLERENARISRLIDKNAGLMDELLLVMDGLRILGE